MADIYILLRDDAVPLYAWINGGRWVCTDAASKVKGNRGQAVAIIPGRYVLSLSAPINARSEGEARRMAPYAIEDEIAEPVEEVHVALGPKTEDNGARRLSIISKYIMPEIMADLEEIGFPDAAIMSADTLLPEGNIIIQTRHNILARIGERTFSVEQDIGADLIASLTADYEDLTVYGHSLARNLRVASAGSGCKSDEALLVALAGWSEEADLGINLRQGPFGVRRQMDLKGLAQWRLAGFLAASCALGYYALIIGEAYAYRAQADTYIQTAQSYAARGWPHLNGNVQATLSEIGAGNIVNPNGLSAIGTIAALYQGLEAVPSVKLQALRFDQARRQLSAVVILQDFADGDALLRNMQGLGLDIQIGDARMLRGQLVTEIVVRPLS